MPSSQLPPVRQSLRAKVRRGLAPPFHARSTHLPMTRSLNPAPVPDLPLFPHRTLPIDRPPREPASPDKLPRPTLSPCLAVAPAGQVRSPRRDGTDTSRTGLQKANAYDRSEAPLASPLVPGQCGTFPVGLSRGTDLIGRDVTRDCFDSRFGRAAFSACGGRHAE